MPRDRTPGRREQMRAMRRRVVAHGGTVERVDAQPAALTPDRVEAEKVAAQREYGQRMMKLRASIPAHLRETPQAIRMMQRVASSWVIAPNPVTARRWAAEWAEFIEMDMLTRRTPNVIIWKPGQPIPGRRG